MQQSNSLGAVPSCGGLITRLACEHARSHGIKLSGILHRAGLTIADIENKDLRFGVATQIDCLDRVAKAMGDKLLGFHIGRTMDLRASRFLYYVIASAETLGDGLLNFARYAEINNEGIKIEVSGRTKVKYHYAGVPRFTDRHQIEAWVVALIRYCREASGRRVQPISVRMMHDRIPESKELDSFFGCVVEFGAHADEVQFSSEAVHLPLVKADPHLNGLIAKYCDEVLKGREVAPRQVRTSVENLIASLLPHGQAQVDIVARKLNIAPRTLHRRLAAEGISFAGILRDLRITLARRYLAAGNLPISRIAWLLGYTEVSSFSHAFRRWTGQAPRATRSKQ
jgi:AraC-like DNA-binding protein